MTKIRNVQNSFEKIESELKTHEISIIFFNNYSHFVTTLNGDESTKQHEDIFKYFKNIKCSSITDFSCILSSLNKLKELELDKKCLDKTISIILTDGHHTVDHNMSLEKVTFALKKKFDYGIGLGDDYDHDLLHNISKNIIIPDNKENIFNFLFNKNDFFHFQLEPNNFYIFDNMISFIDDNIINNEISNESMENSKQSIQICSENDDYKLFELKKTLTKTNHTENEKEKLHYLFVVDISGSMDDFLFSDSHSQTNSTPDKTLFNYFHWPKNNKPKYIQILNKTNKLLSNIYLSDKIDQKLKSFDISQMKDEFHSLEDEFFYTCFYLFCLKTKPHQKVQIWYRILKINYKNDILKDFVENEYNTLLSIGEQRMNVFLNVKIDSNKENVNFTIIEDNKAEDIKKCSICFSKNKRVLFSCGHFALCFKCTVEILNNTKDHMSLSCPICRDNIRYIRKIIFPNINDIHCIKCKTSIANVFQDTCCHTIYCSKCIDTNNKFCDVCHSFISFYKSFHFT